MEGKLLEGFVAGSDLLRSLQHVALETTKVAVEVALRQCMLDLTSSADVNVERVLRLLEYSLEAAEKGFF